MIKVFVILFIVNFIIFPQEKNMLLVKFNEPLDSISALNVNNYSIYKYSDLSNLNIYDIKFVNKINNVVVDPPNSSVVLFIERPDYKYIYRLVITGVKDTSGNSIEYSYIDFSFDGIKYEFNIQKPKLKKSN